MSTARQSRSGRPYRTLRTKLKKQWSDEGRPCWLCGQPINYELPGHHRAAFTMDHLHPVWAGGSDTDPANYAPAHRSCNSRRGAIETNKRRNATKAPRKAPTGPPCPTCHRPDSTACTHARW